MNAKSSDFFTTTLIVIGLSIAFWHAVQHAYHWTVRFLHHLLPLIPWHTLAWVGGFAGALLLTVMVARHRVHQRRSAR